MSRQNYAITALSNLLKLAIGRGRVQTVDDSGPVQILQLVLSPKETPNLPRLAEFGFQSWPPEGSDAVVVFVAGNRSNGVAIATGNQRLRLKLENPGEAALSDAFGKYVWLKKESMEIDAGGKEVVIKNAAGITITSTQDVTLNMGGKKVIINNPGEVQLAGAGGKKVVLDGDPVSGGVVHASSTKVTGL
jgi:phage baseplate assembly protein V